MTFDWEERPCCGDMLAAGFQSCLAESVEGCLRDIISAHGQGCEYDPNLELQLLFEGLWNTAGNLNQLLRVLFKTSVTFEEF